MTRPKIHLTPEAEAEASKMRYRRYHAKVCTVSMYREDRAALAALAAKNKRSQVETLRMLINGKVLRNAEVTVTRSVVAKPVQRSESANPQNLTKDRNYYRQLDTDRLIEAGRKGDELSIALADRLEEASQEEQP
jgi:hypothetical protein